MHEIFMSFIYLWSFMVTSFYTTAVICRAQCCNPGISHSLFSEHQSLSADRARSAGVWDCIERSNAAIFRQESEVSVQLTAVLLYMGDCNSSTAILFFVYVTDIALKTQFLCWYR